MGTATSIRLSKPRISALILEATAAAVALILVVWLLLWFIRQHAPRNTVEAFSVRVEGVAAEDAPFQAADVRLLRGEPRELESGGDLVDRVRKECSNRSGPLVLYVTAPVLGSGPATKGGRDQWIRPLLDVLAGSTVDVVLAVDVSQIDTDRRLGVYGNAACAELLEAARELQPRRRIFILTAAAPAQKSWSADGLGHSIFAYYLRQGLAGGDRPADGAESSTITVQELHEYVLRHVREWVRKHRHGAAQTPMLLTILPDPKDSPGLALRVMRENHAVSPPIETDAGPTAAKPAEVLTKSDAKLKSEAAVTPQPPAVEKVADTSPAGASKAMIAGLLEEWKRYDVLKDKRPYRSFPGTWRAYQADLLRAERRVRAAWLDPTSLDRRDRATDGLERARRVGDALGRSWDARNAEDDNFPFRSVIGEGTGAGKAELHAALSYLTFRGSDDAELRPLVPSVPVAGVGKGDGQPQPAQPVSRDVPAGLLKRTPDTYLELQLPAWAYRFTEEFHRREYFERDGRRGKALRAIVRARADAERALDLDRRGLSWIGPFIRDGDEVRRVVQDELFTGTREDHLSNDWTPRVEKVRSFYKRALDASEAFRKARETWEAAAAELPWLVEWAIRHESHRPGSTFVPTDPFPADVETAMRDFASLSAVLAAETIKEDRSSEARIDRWFDDLEQRTEATRKSLSGLRNRLQEAVDRLSDERDWVELDAALRTPLIPAAKREALLDRLQRIQEPADRFPPEPGARPADPSDDLPDPGYWLRAAGLARLDLSLSRIGLDPLQAEEDGPNDKALKNAMSQAKAWKPRGADANEGRPTFPNFSAAVLKGAEDRNELDASALSATEGTRYRVEPVVAGLDRRARLIDGWRLDRNPAEKIDEAAMRYWLLGRYAALEIQFRRLQADFDDGTALVRLAREAKRIAGLVPLAADPRLDKISGVRLKVDVDPRDRLPLKNLTGDLRVIFEPPAERGATFPPGQAFVGLDVPDALEILNRPPDAELSGFTVAIGKRDSTESSLTEAKYHLVQRIFDSKAASFPVRAIAFYRGRVDEESVARVDVQPAPSEDLVTVRIGPDRKVWAQKYPGVDPDTIKDQFEAHQHEGYMHLGKSLNYLLTFQNQFPRELWVRCKIERIDLAEQKPENAVTSLRDEDWRFGPKGSGDDTRTFDGTIYLSAENPDHRQKLRVTLTASNRNNGAGGASLMVQKQPFEVTFSQIRFDKYMTFDEAFAPNCREDHKGRAPCYVITYTRRLDDHFTEPIGNDEWSCNVDDRASSLSKRYWILPGQAVQYHHFHDDFNKVSFKWFGRIEKEIVEGETGKGSWPRKTEPSK